MHLSSKKVLITRLPIVAAVSLCIGLSYSLMQQTVRLGANISAAALLDNVVAKVDQSTNQLQAMTAISQSRMVQDPFVIFFDANKTILASSFISSGEMSTIPGGVFDYTKAHGEDRVTRQTPGKVRYAIVMRYLPQDGGLFLVAGNPLAQYQWLIDQLGIFSTIARVCAMIATLVVVVAVQLYKKSN